MEPIPREHDLLRQSASNLVDYSLISKERYDIPALSDPPGRYGAWRWDALTVYGVGLLAQLPFLVTHFYTGPLVEPLGGADISWIVGLVVPAALYWLIARRDTSHIPTQSQEPRLTAGAGPR